MFSLSELLRSLQLGIILGHGEQTLQRSGELILGDGLALGRGGLHGLGAELGNVFERPFFVRGVALDGLDQVGDQVVPPLELHINVRPGRVAAHPQLHQAVVHPDEHNGDDDEDDEEDDADHERVLGGRRIDLGILIFRSKSWNLNLETMGR